MLSYIYWLRVSKLIKYIKQNSKNNQLWEHFIPTDKDLNGQIILVLIILILGLHCCLINMWWE